MLLPTLLLLLMGAVAGRLVEPRLVRVGDWMERTSGETTAWIVGIVGFLMAGDAMVRIPAVLDVLVG